MSPTPPLVRQSLKTLLPLLVVLALLFLGVSYYTGYAAERALRQQLALNQVQAARQGYDLQLLEYRRGLLRSRATVTLAAQASQWILATELSLQHGPLVHSEGRWQPGLFELSAQLLPDSRMQALNPSVDWGALFDELTLVGQFGSGYRLRWQLPELAFNAAGNQWSLSGSELLWRGDYRRIAGEGELTLAPVTVITPEGYRFASSASQLDFALSYLQDWSLEGHSRWQAERLSWSGPGQMPIALEQLDWQWRQEVSEGHFHTDYSLESTRVSMGPFAATDLSAQTRIRGLPVELFQRWEYLAQELPGVEPQRWLEVADDTLSEDLSAQGQIRITLGEGPVNADWRAHYRGLAPGQTLEHWQDAGSLLDAELAVRVSEATLSSTPLYWLFAEQVDRYLQPDGNQRLFEAQWRDGDLQLNPAQ